MHFDLTMNTYAGTDMTVRYNMVQLIFAIPIPGIFLMNYAGRLGWYLYHVL
jgi:hypothetical protein